MHKYLIERTVPGVGQMDAAGLAAIANESNKVLRDLGPDIQWVHSYVTDDKITCVYVAASEEIVREHGRCGGFPDRRGARSPRRHRPDHRGAGPMSRAAISLTTGLEDPEKVTVALLVAVGAAESRPGRPHVLDQGGRSPGYRRCRRRGGVRRVPTYSRS